jgi:hypothetical protein
VHNSNPLLLAYNPDYLPKVLGWYNLKCEAVGQVHKVKGFDNYNYLIDINAVFSNRPVGNPIDRSGQIRSPLKFAVNRPWQVPNKSILLEDFAQERVNEICQQQQMINIMWSGGIDSTTTVTAFLKNCCNLDQIRIIYSPYSTYEHPTYLNFLKQFPAVQTVDISGDVYRTHEFDGVFVTGHGGDELTASVDESFFEAYGYETLQRPWKEFFYEQNSNLDFLNFCEEYFKQSGRPIDTVLEARWFLYLCCKNTPFWVELIDLFSHYKKFSLDRIIPFFDCEQYEKYIFFNTDQIFIGTEYRNWKQGLKNYCYQFDHQQDWFETKAKTGSQQPRLYYRKHKLLQDRRWIFLLENLQNVNTPSLPLLSRKEFTDRWGTSMDYLINEPG